MVSKDTKIKEEQSPRLLCTTDVLFVFLGRRFLMIEEGESSHRSPSAASLRSGRNQRDAGWIRAGTRNKKSCHHKGHEEHQEKPKSGINHGLRGFH
jgi:hypothetical protein